MTANERSALRAYPLWERSTADSLSHVYSRYSDAKARAWEYCQNLQFKYNGWGLRVVTHNQQMFTAGFLFEDPETGVLKYMHITKSYDCSVEVPC